MKRHFAILTMILAWLIYGAMPALADCPICDSELSMTSDMASATPMDGIGGMDMHGDGKHVGHEHASHGVNPCSGDMAHMSVCAACLIMPPFVAVDAGKPFAFSYPAPALSDPLHENRPAPLAPPPRLI
jgi:hypothetical protein